MIAGGVALTAGIVSARPLRASGAGRRQTMIPFRTA
jgi:hypothetical protein